MRSARPPPTPIRWQPSSSPITGCSTPGAATADEITDFMAQSPDWPNQALLERRRQEAIAADPDLASTLAQCERNTLTLPQTMLHCAEALANAGRNAEAAEEARRAWVAGIGDEAAFLRRWSGAVRPDDHWERFQRLAWHDAGRGRATGPAPRSAAPRRGRGAAGPAARRAERRRAARRPARRAAARSRHDAGSRPLAAPMPIAPRTRWPCGSAPARPHSATRRRMSSRRSGPSATCWRAACCATAMPPVPMRSPLSTAGSRRSRCWTPSSWRASSRCAG